MENKIKELLKKQISGHADKADRKVLKETVRQMPDYELDEMLKEIWYEYDGTKELNDFDLILNKIRPSRRRIQFKFVASIAASVLICIMIVTQVYYYNTNKNLNKLINEEKTVNIESNEKTTITLPDGSKVILNAGSTISYSTGYGLKTREVNLTGEAFLDITKNPDKPFMLHTAHIGIEVLGTKFVINDYTNSDRVETTLIDGSIKLTTKGTDSQTIIMHPNEKATYNKDSEELLVIEKSATHFETAWLEGKLVFRSAGFKDIIKKLEQRYGVEIEIVNMEKYNTDPFTGTFKEDYVNGVLKILKLHYNFDYTDNNGNIRIYLN